MNQLIDFVFSSTGVVSVLVAAALWLAIRPSSRGARRFLIAAAAGALLVSTYTLPYAVAHVVLMRGFLPITAKDIPSGRSVIVLLGGGAETVRGWDQTPLSVPSADGLERVLEAARVHRLVPGLRIISSGGVLDQQDEPNGLVMRDALIRLGVPLADIVVETASSTTHDQAVLVAPMLRSAGAEHVILVTSATHMTRALGTFRAAGIDAIPAIAPGQGFRQPLRAWLIPHASGLGLSRQVAHGIIGLAYYRLKGWWRRPNA